jgi:tetratricopeptide (TPR) repeat protein
MYNLLISLAAGLAVTLAIHFGTSLGWAGAVFPGVLTIGVTYFVLARRTWKQFEALMGTVQKEVLAQKLDRALQTLEGGFSLAPWQFMIASQIHSQIGVLRYVRQDYAGAQPHLEKSFSRHGIARGMLAVTYYRKKDLERARKAFDDATKDNKKEGLLFAVWAWMEEKEGNHDRAIAVLARGLKANPSDDKLKAAAQALQNDKKLKLGKLYGEQWFQFHLEQMPPQMASPMGGRGGRRVVYQRR